MRRRKRRKDIEAAKAIEALELREKTR
jgi:hypothetical protein